jgi:hypothetical protein
VRGNKTSFINRDAAIGFGVPELTYPFRWIPNAEWLEIECGRSCGIGVSWDDNKGD